MLKKLTTQQEAESPPLRGLEDVTDQAQFHGALRAFIANLRGDLRGLRIYKARYGFYVGYSTDLFAVGRLWWGDPSSGYSSNKKYCVFSPRVVNKKYKADSENYYMVSASDERTALSHAKKFFRRWTPEENGLRMTERADRVVTRFHSNQKQKVYSATNALLNTPQLRPQYVHELVVLANSGYQFVDAEFGTQLNALIKSHQELTIMEQKNNERWFIVYINQNDAGQTLVVRVPINVKGAPTEWGRSFDLDGNAIVCSPEYVPEDVQGRLAVLQMVEDEHYVEGVGVRIQENCYYVVMNG